MKEEYDIEDTVWIHTNDRNLTKGRVVEIFDLSHLDKKNTTEFYVIEVDTPIEPVYEVRTFEQISSNEKGPINLFRDLSVYQSGKLFKRLGMPLPEGAVEPENAQAEEPVKIKPKRRYYRTKK